VEFGGRKGTSIAVTEKERKAQKKNRRDCRVGETGNNDNYWSIASPGGNRNTETVSVPKRSEKGGRRTISELNGKGSQMLGTRSRLHKQLAGKTSFWAWLSERKFRCLDLASTKGRQIKS